LRRTIARPAQNRLDTPVVSGLMGRINQKPTVMPMKFFGKVLFPHLPRWKQKQQARILVWVILAAVIFAVVVAAIMLHQNAL
jgi:hypothetical protein